MIQFYSRNSSCLFFFNDTPTTEISTLSLHDALPICRLRTCLGDQGPGGRREAVHQRGYLPRDPLRRADEKAPRDPGVLRSEEHTSELQSRQYLVCRLLLEKKNIEWISYPQD